MDRDLHDLLYCHDCVIVPQWGGFLTHYRSARLDEARNLVHPPGKDLSFNKQLTRNDGLLADHLAKRTGMAFDEASAHIDKEVKEWRGTLDRQGRLELPHIGIFYRDAEHNLQFDPDRRSNFLKDAYGLRPLAAVAVQQIVPEREPIRIVPLEPSRKEIATPVIPLPKPIEEGSDKRLPVLWAAAAMVAVLFAAAAFWLIQQDTSGPVQWSSLDPFGPQAERTYVPPLDQGVPALATAGIFTLPDEPLGVREMPLTINDSVSLIVDLGSPEPPVMKPDSIAVATPARAEAAVLRKRFHIVGGCFAEPGNADRFLGDLRSKGYDAVQLDLHRGLHPVAFGSFATRREALDALTQLRSEGAGSAWLLIR